MSDNYTHITDLAKEVEPPEDGILTRTLFNDEDVKAVIFGFGQGEELSEHTASMPAILHFISGPTRAQGVRHVPEYEIKTTTSSGQPARQRSGSVSSTIRTEQSIG